MNDLNIGTVVVFDATFNHPALRDITAGKEYSVAGMTDADEPKPYVIDNSNDANARALEICEYRIVRQPVDLAGFTDPEPEDEVVAPAVTKSRYIVSYSVNDPSTSVKRGNIAITFNSDEDPDVMLRKMQYDAAEAARSAMAYVHIDGIFKL